MRDYPVIPAACLAVALSGGCAAAPESGAQQACPDERTVWVVDHGRHAGLVVSRDALVAARPGLARTLPAGSHVEIGWGDARYYPDPYAGIGLALRAALWPTASVLHLVVLPEPPPQYFSAAEVLSVGLSEAGHRELLAFVADSFELDADSDSPRRLGQPLYGQGGFYAARERFHLLNTCNTWVARGLERAGRAVSADWVVTVEDLMSQLREAACAESAAPHPSSRTARQRLSGTRTSRPRSRMTLGR
jgi:uncharacterized protein (TIGR02117 family)